MFKRFKPRRNFAQLSRKRLAQQFSMLAPIAESPSNNESKQSAANNGVLPCFCSSGLGGGNGYYDTMSRYVQRKYIQVQSIPRRTRWLFVLGCLSLAIIFIIDRATMVTTSSSKWARMMYEDQSAAPAAAVEIMGGNIRASHNNDNNNDNSQQLPPASMERPRDLHIAFVGDSVTRYMYLDFVYYLKTNRWVHDEDYPNILNAKHFPSWNDHYNASMLALAPHEECDCFRLNPKNSSHIDKEETIENRYFSDHERNNYATFIEIFGGYPPHGHWQPNQVYKKHVLDFEQLQTDPFVWKYDWPGLIRNYLNKLEPGPEYLVFNEGLWIEHELGNEDVRQSIKDALDETGIIGIYKTTTLPNINSGLAKRSAGVVFNRHDEAMCDMFENYLDLTWTKDLGDEHYWDGVHFKPHVNRGMNMELLDKLQKLREKKQETTAVPIRGEEQ